MDRVPPSPHHRHQASLEDIIIFSDEPQALNAAQRSQAEQKFYRIVRHFEAAEGGTRGSNSSSSQYSRPLLIRFTYEYARSRESQDIFLRALFHSMALSLDGEDDVDFENDEEHLRAALFLFADYLFDNLFLPLRASSGKTPQLSPLVHSAIMRAQGGEAREFLGTPERIASLRGECLIRDRHRCVISRQFDLEEAKLRVKADGGNAVDDDGNPLMAADSKFAHLEVAHILPHSLTKMGNGTDGSQSLPPSKKAALDILNMFDKGVAHFIEGNDIDRPRNALTLTQQHHTSFGCFDIFFEPLPGQEANTYQIRSFLPPLFIQDLPVVRTLFLTESRSIEPPSARFLALHRAIAHILHFSGAGDYIQKILRDMEWKDTREDGSTELGYLTALRLGERSGTVRT